MPEATRTPAGSALIGRDEERQRLVRLLDAAAAGTARFVLVEGEPGIGKSRLLAELIDAAFGRGFTVLSARAEELEQDRAFGVIGRALGIDPGTPPALTGGDAGAPASPVRHQLFDRIVEVAGDLAATRPLLLVLDDLQWADPESLDALDLLARRLTAAPVLLAGASRPIPRSTALARLANGVGGTAERMQLRPLDEDAVAQLAESLAGRPIGSGLARHAAGAGGNPFFVRELVIALEEDGLIALVDGRAEVATTVVPPSLRATIMRRFGFLPEATLDLLRWASVLGSTVAVTEVARAADVSVPTVIRGLEPAVRSDVMVDAGERLAFRHDLVREAIYDDIPRAVRAGMHLEVARRRLEGGGRALDAAPHFDRGVVGRDIDAAEWMRRAAAEVTAQSPATAVDLLERARQMTAPGDDLRDTIGFDMVRALLWSGRWADAEEMARQILERDPESPRSAALHYALARSFAYRGRIAESIAEAEAAIASPATTQRERARLSADVSLRRPLAGDLEGGEAAARRALEIAESDNTLARRTALSGLALVAALRGRTAEAVEIARSAVPLSPESAAEAVELVQPTFFLTIVLTEAGGYEEALELMRRLRQRVETRMSWVSALVGVLIGHLLFLKGEWTDAEAEAETALELSEETGTRVWSLRALAMLTAITAHRADRERAAQLLHQGDRLVEEVGRAHVGFDHWLVARATVAEAAGDQAEALSRLESAWNECLQLGWVISRREVGPRLVRLAMAAGRPDLGQAVAASVAEAAALPAAPPTMTAAANHCRGLVDGDPVSVGHAVHAYRLAGRKLTLAEALEDRAGLLQSAGRPGEAREALEEAVATYAALGTEVGRLRAEQRLRQLGVRRGAAGTRRRPDTGWDSLTGSERQIALLAAEGLTNRQIGERLFVSHRTVATHLAHIFGKLGLSSRVELARAVGNKSVM